MPEKAKTIAEHRDDAAAQSDVPHGYNSPEYKAAIAEQAEIMAELRKLIAEQAEIMAELRKRIDDAESNVEPPVGESIAALVAAMPPLRKDTEGQEGNRTYKYIPLDQIVAAFRPGTTQRGWSVTSSFDLLSDLLIFRSSLIDEHGKTLTSSWLPAGDIPTEPKQLGKWITYMRRYTISMMLCLVADEDDDYGVKGLDDGAQASEPDAPPEPTVTEQLNLLKGVAELTDDQQTELGRELIAFAKSYGATKTQVIELLPELFEKNELVDLTSGEFQMLMNEIESRAS